MKKKEAENNQNAIINAASIKKQPCIDRCM